MARELHVAPWVVESDCPQAWWDRWVALREVEAEVLGMRKSKDGGGD